MKIAVLAGGISSERAVSLRSGLGVARALCARGHAVLLCDPVLPLCDDFSTQIPDRADTDETERALPPVFRFGRGVLDALRQADMTFLALHGGAGEDGTVQAALDALGIPFTGSRAQACVLAQDKALSKYLFRQSGIPVPRAHLLRAKETPPDTLSYPCVAKPRDGGSSVGVCICPDRAALLHYLEQNPSTEPLLLEAYIDGTEYSVGILEGRALPPVEILPHSSFYDYESKYRLGGAVERCPAPSLSPAESEQLCALALRAHRALGLGGYSRIDFVRRAADGVFYCLEANALPGMTPTSLFPLCARAVGLSYADLCERILFAKEEGRQ